MTSADIAPPDDSGNVLSSIRQALGTLKVQRRACATCIYGHNWHGTSIEELEAQVADGYGGFNGSRICHHSDNVTCRGFWNRHKDDFQAGQVAQRLVCVEFVDIDTRPEMLGGQA
jgi:hypothetical protein